MQKLTKRQKEIVDKVRSGWVLFTGLSDSTGRQYFGVSLGYDNDYFNVTVWGALIEKDIIRQSSEYPFNWELNESYY